MSDRHMAQLFEFGERVQPADCFGWAYTELSGQRGEPGVSLRYFNGAQVLELIAQVDRKTQSEDEHWWAEKNSPRSF